ncbi:MAG: NmrA/HSCARG family protein, partial [Gammaproteobacteria bacterium]|nr:NmrA/HSCARG family protein [Gammaproteobacteria bacterium]
TQGGSVARELISRGYQVRGLTRNPDSEASRALATLGVEMVQGNFDDPASLDRTMEGVDGVFSVQQYRGVGVDGEIRQGRAFADAAKRAGVGHFVYTSVLYARLDSGVPQFESKRQIEDYVRSLGISYSIIRPASFMSNLEADRESALNGIYRSSFPPEKARLHIAPQDIGRFAVEAFDDPEAWNGREIDIAGDRISYTDIAAAMTRVIGRTVLYEPLSAEEYAASATATDRARDQWYLELEYPLDLEALRAEFPWLMTVEDYLREAGWGAN